MTTVIIPSALEEPAIQAGFRPITLEDLRRMQTEGIGHIDSIRLVIVDEIANVPTKQLTARKGKRKGPPQRGRFWER